MNKIKIVSLLIFLLSILLTVVSIYISNQNKLEIKTLNTINIQKAFTQEISKNIFYIYKKQTLDENNLDKLIKNFMMHVSENEKELHEISSKSITTQNDKIIKLWNKFYLSVQEFRNISKVTTIYSNIILEKIVNDIYNTNLMLIIEFDNLIKINQLSFDEEINIVKNIQYTLLFLLLSLLIYLFAQLKIIISFIQKFLNTSKSIIKNSTIQGLKPINVSNTKDEILEASSNFNFLVGQINNSVKNASDSMQHSYKSLEQVEKNIEDMLNLLYTMQEDDSIDKDLTKKEDAIIQSLEELSSSAINLKNLKTNLDYLISHQNLKK
jgi:hypothetical protein